MSIEKNYERPDILGGKAARANDRQVGGDHYKVGGEEHWDRVARLGLDYFQGQITKYVERWKLKGGIQDLKKARHFLDKYIEMNEPPMFPPIANETPDKPLPMGADPVVETEFPFGGVVGRMRSQNGGGWNYVAVHEMATLETPRGTIHLCLISWDRERNEKVWVDASLVEVRT